MKAKIEFIIIYMHTHRARTANLGEFRLYIIVYSPFSANIFEYNKIQEQWGNLHTISKEISKLFFLTIFHTLNQSSNLLICDVTLCLIITVSSYTGS